MGVLIVGSGLAGLMSAIKIKECDPMADVALLEKERPTGNTQISGLRFRQKEIAELLSVRNNGRMTDEMRLFSLIAQTELDEFMKRITHESRNEWFGPQMTNGIGTRMLSELRRMAQERGIRFIAGEAIQLIRDRNKVMGVKTIDSQISADMTILANGTAMGELFLSTNRPVNNSSHLLAFRAGLPLQDTTIHMFHPFGKCDENGNPKLGCFETDKLAGAEVSYMDGKKDPELSAILNNHEAHNNFPAITERIVSNGGVVRLDFPDGKVQHARVSHHYGHMGITTDDGVKVRGTKGVLAVGDASNLGYWTNHKERLPGYALLKCLVDAKLVADHIDIMSDGEKENPVVKEGNTEREDIILKPKLDGDLRKLNTEMLFRMKFGNEENPVDVAREWSKSLMGIRKQSLLAELSYEIAKAHYLRARHPEIGEPLGIRRETVPMGEFTRQRKYL